MFSKKISKYLMGIVTASVLAGCGGGGGGSSTPSTSTDVTVERGPLFGAVVKDAKGVVATAKSKTSNVYTFANTPSYPITATDGYIDVNGDGAITTADIEFSGELKSYSNVVTPITTYIAKGLTETERTAKINELKTKLGGTVSDDDLIKKVPSSTTADIIALTNAIYDSYGVLFDADTTNDDVSSVTTLDDDLLSYKAVIQQSGAGKSVKELASLVEEELIVSNNIQRLTQDKVNEYNTPSTPFISGKTVIVNDDENPVGHTTFIFESNGNYEESGFEKGTVNDEVIPYTCYGKWSIFGDKVASTCDEGDNYKRFTPTGDLTKGKDIGEIHFYFSDTTLSVNSQVNISFVNDDGSNGTHKTTIKSVSTSSSTSSSTSDLVFTSEYLNNKTFYTVVMWDDWVMADDTFINGNLYHKNTPDGNFIESYEVLSDGTIKVTTDEGFFIWSIESKTNDYIKVNSNDGINNYGYFFFNKSLAQQKLSELQAN